MKLVDFFLTLLGRTPQVSKEDLFFRTTFALLGKLAMADGQVVEREIQTVERFIDSSLNLEPKHREVALKLFTESQTSEIDHLLLAKQLVSSFPNSSPILSLVLNILYLIAYSDGEYSESEGQMIEEIADIFGINTAKQEMIRARHLTSTDSSREIRYHNLLGCDVGCSGEMIQKAYEQACALYSPQNAKTYGIPSEFRLVLEKHFEEIDEAYNILLKQAQA